MASLKPIPVAVRRVDPDPSITSAIGRHHSLSTAVADLVDNSIDARARHVLVRILLTDGHGSGLLVVDDGDGMDSEIVDAAMTYARRRTYTGSDLGHFGIGLKAASLSQADTLLVWSRAYGSPAVGRGLERSTLDTGPMMESFSTDDATARFGAVDVVFPLPTGTVVEWRDIRSFLHSPDPAEQTGWLERTLEDLRTHLGIVFHRILTAGLVAVVIDVLDEQYPEFGSVPRTVEAVDPFGYPVSGVTGYPETLGVSFDASESSATVHVWPGDARSDPGFSLGRRPAQETQGFYIYRRDRLLQAGGWNDVVVPTRDLAFARVAVDVDHALEPHITINPEKTGVVFDAELRQVWHRARLASGHTFADYLDAARAGAHESRRRNPRPVQVVEPGRGWTSAMLDAFEDNTEYVPGEDPVDIRWRVLYSDEVFRIDRDERTIWLNSRYRAALGGSGLSNDDAQVVKALLHMLLGGHITGSFSGPNRRRTVAAWQAILLAAVGRSEDQEERA